MTILEQLTGYAGVRVGKAKQKISSEEMRRKALASLKSD